MRKALKVMFIGYPQGVKANSIEADPLTFEKSIVSDSKKQWKDAIEAKFFSLQKNQIWSLVSKLPNQKLIQSKWIYKIKSNTGGDSKPRYKARWTSLHNLCMEELKEVIYMAQPKGYEVKGKEDIVYCLHKSIYGVKQSPRQWYIRFDTFIIKQRFHRNSYDAYICWKLSQNGMYIFLLLYVDDMILVSKDYAKICELKKLLSNEFEMKDFGELKRILGIVVKRDREKGIVMNQNYCKASKM
ncbi:Retrovirus-related Pol polyprotein from transposon TNT 1-94 [Cucumis melo var. makuwa]|uniref:Retrovirus-related Pol polyprotein from transposon TNT 1-94 n=1 Tax=Cucumis melo var. makuwa TaxID=1194695 RepID=A0A5A7SX40_CUCMM|nr:Retrovirus-related Pol polyprotein from transposon TNT 1-94 [Cucumis melo var. makuwa]TYK19059.1 Retrovirus-related Pol polyprotein from transposon TNT 1-94 [Cucumis melo var. makuwa]